MKDNWCDKSDCTLAVALQLWEVKEFCSSGLDTRSHMNLYSYLDIALRMAWRLCSNVLDTFDDN